MELHKSGADGILLAIAMEKRAFARLAAAAQACPTPKDKRLYNQLALDELKRLLELVSLMDGLADEWLARLDLTLPPADLPDPDPASDEAIQRSATEGKEQSQGFFGHLTQGVDREEMLALLEYLRSEEEDHRTRLQFMLHGLEADRPVVATRPPAGPQSLRRRVPAEHRQ